ncbi:MAG: 50S ribosomal protein L22 [Clostridia bacterium]|jgi:large subunit ribosomal protein L22|nr:50S ribosomal protein L22 [Clostridia bacterium]
MEAKAYLKYLRISPRKVKIVLDLIRGKDTTVAAAILKNTPKAASPEIGKLLKSAIANAEHNFGMDAQNLYVSECFVCPGPTLKRLLPRAKGSGDRILKRTSHVTLAVAEKNADKEVKE